MRVAEIHYFDGDVVKIIEHDLTAEQLKEKQAAADAAGLNIQFNALEEEKKPAKKPVADVIEAVAKKIRKTTKKN